ncbi:hypothetical protein C2E21_1325 [Chlorella sorokiniana]|uniref:Complex I assembly factor TIMMDC1, mitochondrial n=1 Tax=Chlorella sorokiniana TaxID=3076 RepID=A0A2P6U236_CHLSO|nr:hypothetical protein C2E21_1325 [Chlorella sorokiniana]|eukprot:PRW60374.1 hypothetical protein C2E21_1325 [Chlorella sorokiniana]
MSTEAPQGGAAPPQEADGLTGWQRLGRLFGYAFARHDPTTDLAPMPEEFREWAQDTLLATMAGMVFGGGKSWLEESRRAPAQAPPDAPTKLHAARAIAEENTQRLSRMANASLRGGLLFCGLAGTFYAVKMLSGVYRNRRDFLDSAHGGMAAGALFGVSLHRSVKAKVPLARSIVLGAALGASMGIPIGLLQEKIYDLLPEDQRVQRQRRVEHTEAVIAGTVESEHQAAAASRQYDVTAAVIQQLEASLSSSPTQRQQQQQQQGGGHRVTARHSGRPGFKQPGTCGTSHRLAPLLTTTMRAALLLAALAALLAAVPAQGQTYCPPYAVVYTTAAECDAAILSGVQAAEALGIELSKHGINPGKNSTGESAMLTVDGKSVVIYNYKMQTGGSFCCGLQVKVNGDVVPPAVPVDGATSAAAPAARNFWAAALAVVAGAALLTSL